MSCESVISRVFDSAMGLIRYKYVFVSAPGAFMIILFPRKAIEPSVAWTDFPAMVKETKAQLPSKVFASRRRISAEVAPEAGLSGTVGSCLEPHPVIAIATPMAMKKRG